MDDYKEYLFDTVHEDLRQCVNHLAEGDIESCCEYRVFLRGIEYFNDGAVGKIEPGKNSNSIEAVVEGTRKYSVALSLEDGGLYGTCNCPYDDVCKHIVAVLLHLKEKEVPVLSRPDKHPGGDKRMDETLKNHFDALSKSELVGLLMDFAPRSYVTRVQNQAMADGDASGIFTKVEKRIDELFSDEELLWDPAGFEGVLMDQVKLLQGLESRMADEIGALLIMIIDGVDNVFNEGYLYIDGYPDDEYFESDDFCDFVIDFARMLPLERKMEFLPELAEALDRMSYDTFSQIDRSFGSFFQEHEYPLVRDSIFQNEDPSSFVVLSRIYDDLDACLTDPEREKLLSGLSNYDYKFTLRLVRLLTGQGRISEAYGIIKERIEGAGEFAGDEMFEMYLDLSRKAGMDMLEPASKAIEACPTPYMLSKIKTLVSKGQLGRYELILKRRNADQLFYFYQEENRPADALELIREGLISRDPTVFRFFKKFKKTFPGEAAAFFEDRIRKNLAPAGQKHYEIIAETMGQLKQVNPGKADELLELIRTQYKRRRNLLGMLERY